MRCSSSNGGDGLVETGLAVMKPRQGCGPNCLGKTLAERWNGRRVEAARGYQDPGIMLL